MKKPWVALVLSFVFPGLGHFYINQPKKGAILIVSYLISLVLTSVLIGIFTLFAVWIYSMADSYKFSKSLNRLSDAH